MFVLPGPEAWEWPELRGTSQSRGGCWVTQSSGLLLLQVFPFLSFEENQDCRKWRSVPKWCVCVCPCPCVHSIARLFLKNDTLALYPLLKLVIPSKPWILGRPLWVCILGLFWIPALKCLNLLYSSPTCYKSLKTPWKSANCPFNSDSLILPLLPLFPHLQLDSCTTPLPLILLPLFLHSPFSYLNKSVPPGKQNKGHINIWWSAGLTSVRSPFPCSFLAKSVQWINSHSMLAIHPSTKLCVALPLLTH